MAKVDIRFIAAVAQVSPATVSRVFNGTKPVSPELKRRVLQAAETYHYRANMMARGLAMRRSNLIGIVAPTVSSHFHAHILDSAEAEAAARGYNILVSNATLDFSRQKDSFYVLMERQVDGILLLHENTARELEILRQIASVPIVMSSINAPDNPLPVVGIDDRQAAYDGTSWLIGLGHKKIGAIFNDCYSLNVLRRQGFEEALREHGLSVNAQWLRVGRCCIADGKLLAREIFLQEDHPTALFCVSDEQAVGAVDFLVTHGFQVPKDVSVMGFDDVELCEVVRPRLTTIRQPIEEIGRQATRLLLDLIAGARAPQRIVLPHTLIKRDSTCCCSQ